MTVSKPIDPSLAFHVCQYVPDAAGVELEHRMALLKCRSWAAALRGRTDSEIAIQCASLADHVAGSFVFCPGESATRLDDAVRLCRNLVVAAMRADALNEPGCPI
jgi:hypothetical protein